MKVTDQSCHLPKAAILLLLGILWCQSAQGQLARIVAVEAGNNQQDLAFSSVSLAQKIPVKLTYNQNYLHFTFSNAKDSAQKSFSYKLTGLDYAWISCTNCSRAQYAHLDGGDYTFEVKTAQGGDTPARFSFTIEGQIWHKWWFVPVTFLYFLAFFGIIIYFYVLFQFRQKLREQRLIHKEKMTSMAELTSGIAHEIQNPLNFVNNFSELSVELLADLKEEALSGNMTDVVDMADNLVHNLQKITYHGDRASAIVKGMLEHTRVSIGQHEPTRLNALINEQLRLAYHDFQAKNKTFTCELVIDLAPMLNPVSIIPQEIGRVLLNLFNNAFYAVQEKQRQAPPSFRPAVTIRTIQSKSKIEISVKDNGVGMSESVKAKIFQPFFTTKPTGQGTGMGLSLSFDIITEGHGGTLLVNTREGEGTEFIITLPITTSG